MPSELQGHKITVAYVGTDFAGWQRQPGKVTVQGELERVIGTLWGAEISVQGSGRTDTGVHALGQVASFRAPRKFSTDALVKAANANLPKTIRLVDATFVPESFHARFSATGKTYQYRIHNARVADPFAVGRCWHLARRLDERSMRRAARLLLGEHDFASFASNPGYSRETTVRRVRIARIERDGDWIYFTITANGFLYRMVRNLMGALAKVGHGRLTADEFAEILAAHDRSAAPATAPAEGLYLMRVYYGRNPEKPRAR